MQLRLPFLVLSLAALSSLASTAQARPDKPTLEKAVSILTRGTKAGDFDVRAMAIEGLGFAPKAAMAAIKDAVADPQWRVRASAIAALRQQRDPAWEAEIRKCVCDPMIDEQAVLTLVESGGVPKAVGLVLSGLDDAKCTKPDRYARAFVQRATNAPEWLLAGFRAGLKARVVDVRAAFEAELPNLPLPAALPLYKDGFAKFPAPLQTALLARFKAAPDLGDISFVQVLLKGKDTTLAFPTAELLALRGFATGKAVLVEALKSPDPERRLAALKALEPIASSDIYELMKPIIKERETPFAELIQAYRVYLKSNSPKLVTYLENELENTDVPQRAAAITFLGTVKGHAALVDLHPLLGNGPNVIRLAACEAIGKLGQRESIPVLRDALQRETEKDMKLALLGALVAIKDAEIIGVARFYVKDADPDVRRAAVRALTTVPDASAVGDLELASRDRLKDIGEIALFALVDQDPEGRLSLFVDALKWLDPSTFTAFVKRHGDQARAHLEAAFKSERDELRAAAFGALKLLSRLLQVDILKMLALTSDRPSLRIAALDRLVAQERAGAVNTLEALAKDGDEKVRVRTIFLLGTLGHKGAEKDLAGWLDDPSEPIRVAVAGALLRL